MTIRLLVADDHTVMREGLCALLEARRGLKVVGQARTGREVVRIARESEPNLALIDVSMPDLGGIESTRRVIRRNPDVKVLALSMHLDGEFVTEMLRAGASGYVLKTCAVEELVRAIETVAKGGNYLPPEVAAVVADAYLVESSRRRPTGGAALTPRQREVLQLLAEGLTTKQIALRLKRSPKTIEMHRRHLMQKLDLHTIADLTKYAIRRGLVSLES